MPPEDQRFIDRPIVLQVAIVLAAMILDVSAQIWFRFSYRAPRFTTLAVGIIGLRWGCVAGGYWGATGGLILALYAGELPFAPTAALSAAGCLAGLVPYRFVIESYRAIGLALAAAAAIELAGVCLLRWMTPPGGINGPLWSVGWAIIIGPLFYRLIVSLSAPPPSPHLPPEPE